MENEKWRMENEELGIFSVKRTANKDIKKADSIVC